MRFCISKIALLLACLLWGAPAWAVVTWDTATSRDNVGTDTTDSFTHTIGIGSNVYVGVCIVTRGSDGSGSIDVSGVTIDGSAGTSIGTADTVGLGSDIKVSAYGRALGSKNGAITIAPTVSAGDNFRTIAWSVFGVDQGTPIGTIDTDVGSSTTLAGSVSSAVGDLVLGCLGVAAGTTGHTVGADETQRWLNTTDVNSTIDMGMTQPGAATVNINPTWTTGHYSGLLTIPVKAATTVVSTGLLMLMGVGN